MILCGIYVFLEYWEKKPSTKPTKKDEQLDPEKITVNSSDFEKEHGKKGENCMKNALILLLWVY